MNNQPGSQIETELNSKELQRKLRKSHETILERHLMNVANIRRGYTYNVQLHNQSNQSFLNNIRILNEAKREVQNVVDTFLSTIDNFQAEPERREVQRVLIALGEGLYDSIQEINASLSERYNFTVQDYIDFNNSPKYDYYRLDTLMPSPTEQVDGNKLIPDQDQKQLIEAMRLYELYKICLQALVKLNRRTITTEPISEISFLLESITEYFSETDDIQQTGVPEMVQQHFAIIREYISRLDLNYYEPRDKKIYDEIVAAEAIVDLLLESSPISYAQEFDELRRSIKNSPEEIEFRKGEKENTYIREKVRSVMTIFRYMGKTQDELQAFRNLNSIEDLVEATLIMLQSIEEEANSPSHIFKEHGEQLTNDEIIEQFKFDPSSRRLPKTTAGRFDRNEFVAEALVNKCEEIVNELKKLESERQMLRSTIIVSLDDYVGKFFFVGKHKQIVPIRTKNILFVLGFNSLPIQNDAVPAIITAYPTNLTVKK